MDDRNDSTIPCVPAEAGLERPVPIGKPPYGTLTAIDMNRGEIVWQIPLGDSPAVGNPMTYRTRAGRQFVVIATGEGAGAHLMAYALPDA